MVSNGFITPSKYLEHKRKQIRSARGWLLIADNDSYKQTDDTLAKKVVRAYEAQLKNAGEEIISVPFIGSSHEVDREHGLVRVFEDTETCPRLPAHVAGSDAFLFASSHEFTTSNTVNENIYRLLQTVRTLKVHGSTNITVVSPYMPYARQDKPTFSKREATQAKLFADLLYSSGANGILFYDPHNEALRGFFEPNLRVTTLSGLDLFTDIFQKFSGDSYAISVSTDAGGSKPTIRLAKGLNIPYAIGSKYRPEQEIAEKIGIIGDLDGKKVAILTDDETVSFSSMLNIAKELYKEYKVDQIYSAISHMKLTKKNLPKLLESHEKYGLQVLHVTDSVPQTDEIKNLDFVKIHTLDDRIMRTINRLQYDGSISQLYHRG